MMVLVEICFDIDPQRAMAVFGEKDHGKTTLGWNVPKLKTLFSALTNRKHALNKFGVKSSWSFQDYEGYTEAMWIHHFFVMQFVHPYFRPRPDMNLETGLHYNNQRITFLHKKWHKFIAMVDDEHIAQYQQVANSTTSKPHYTMVWKGKRWDVPIEGGFHFSE
jgi:hypothetical protein